MKLVYIFLDNTQSAGVVKKVKSKIRSLNDVGLDVTGVFLNKNIKDTSFDEANKIHYVALPESKLPSIFSRRFIRNYNWYFNVNKANKVLYKTLEAYLEKVRYDLIILRYPLSNASLLKFIQKNSIVLEHNTKELEELEINRNKNKVADYIYRNDKDFAPRVLSLAKGLISVTPEILDYE